jgi:hypothetical protein
VRALPASGVPDPGHSRGRYCAGPVSGGNAFDQSLSGRPPGVPLPTVLSESAHQVCWSVSTQTTSSERVREIITRHQCSVSRGSRGRACSGSHERGEHLDDRAQDQSVGASPEIFLSILRTPFAAL